MANIRKIRTAIQQDLQPCTEAEAIIFAALGVQIEQGNFDPNKALQYE
jgi:hypothetical protein